MGVPRLFKWCREKFPQVFSLYELRRLSLAMRCNETYRTQLPKTSFSVDNLYIDGNPIIHKCAQRVFNYGERKRMMDPYANLSREEKELRVYELTFASILDIMKIAMPSKLVYIAIDGCAPVAKMVQQRQRRFVSALKRTSLTAFDPNCISPGTEFMTRLCDHLKHSIISYITLSKTKVAFILSDANVPGEGEHKIMEYIRDHTHAHTPDRRSCIYGPDGDLIMLTLVSPCNNFIILRDDMDVSYRYVAIDIGEMRWPLVQEFRPEAGALEDNRRIINDFIIMGCLVGNDFLPKIQMFYYLEDGMSLIIDTYKRHFVDKKKYLTSRSGVIKPSQLRRFISCIAMHEKMHLVGNMRKSLDPQLEKKYVDTLLLESLRLKDINSSFSSSDAELFQAFNYDAYREKYNLSLGDDIAKVTDVYYQGLVWTYMYYTRGCPSHEWYYPYYHAPLMSDLSSSITREITFSKGSAHEPLQQLLSILPPKSADLLPQELRYFLLDKRSPLIDMYPTTFDIRYEGKYQEHQGIAMLPHVEYALLKKVYKRSVEASIRESKSNRLSIPFRYVYSDKPLRIRTPFGVIPSRVALSAAL